MCDSPKSGIHCCPRWGTPRKHHLEIRAKEVGEHVRSHDTIAAQLLVMRGHTAVIFSPSCDGLATLDTPQKLLR